MNWSKSLNIFKNILQYGLISIISKGLQFFTIIYLEYELPVDSFVSYGLKYAFQTGITVFTIFGINEGMVSKYLKENSKILILNNSLKIVLIGQILFLVISLSIILYFNLLDYLFPLINGVILGNLMMTSFNYKLTENHSKTRFFLYLPQIIFHVVILLSVFFDITTDMFLISTIFLSFFLLIFNSINIFDSIKSKISYNTFKHLIIESSSYYLIAILGWISGLGFSWIIKYLFDPIYIANYIYLYSFVGIILLMTTSVFSVWDPYYLNAKDKVSSQTQNLFYDLVSICISLITIIVPFFLYFIDNDSESKIFSSSLLLSSFIFYVPVWRGRLYFLELKKGWVFMRLSLICLITSFVIFFFVQYYIGPVSIYLFFIFKSLLLCSLIIKEFYSNDEFEIKFKTQFLLGISSITSIYLMNFSFLFPVVYIIIISLVFIKKINSLRLSW